MTHRTSLPRRPSTGRSASVVLLLGGLALDGCAKAPPPPPPPPPVTVARVIEREIDQSDEFTGRLQAVDVVEVRPRVSGYIQSVTFAEGKEVRRGDVLFVIDPRPYQAELDRANAELERIRTRAKLAQSEVERAKILVAREAISREEFETRTSAAAEALASVKSAEAAVETAKLNLQWTQVRSPISGRISRAEVTAGNLVQGGPPTATLLTTIVSVDPIYLSFETDEQTYLKYGAAPTASNQRNWRDARSAVYMGLANETGYPHKGTLDFVDNQLNPETGTIRARAVFPNPDRHLAPGLFARVKLMGSGRVRAVLIRDAAIGTDQDKKFVLVLKPDGTTDYRPVTLGRLFDGLRVVTKGLASGEQIVVNGLQRVRPGMKVAAAEEAMVPDSTKSLVATNR